MNTRTYEFEPLATDDRRPHGEPAPPEWPRFTVGEIVEIHGVKMRVRKVTVRDVILRPVKGAAVRRGGGE